MATESKPIDLGKLQDAKRHAEVLMRSARRVLDGACTKHDNAVQALENAREKHRFSVEEVDKAKRAVLEGARAVANGG